MDKKLYCNSLFYMGAYMFGFLASIMIGLTMGDKVPMVWVFAALIASLFIFFQTYPIIAFKADNVRIKLAPASRRKVIPLRDISHVYSTDKHIIIKCGFTQKAKIPLNLLCPYDQEALINQFSGIIKANNSQTMTQQKTKQRLT